MKRGFFSKLVALFLVVIMSFGFAGCEILEEVLNQIYPIGHVCEEIWKDDATSHWIECISCGQKKQIGSHDYVDAGTEGELSCSVCGRVKILPKGELEFHFIMLGNYRSGDSIYVKAGENDILIDGGSYYDSIDDIKGYVDNYCLDGKLEYVIVTHADEDHIACFGGTKDGDSLFDLYECETIIDFPLTDKTSQVYQRYVSERSAEVELGAKHFTALECYNQSKEGAQRIYNLTADGNIKMEILYNYYYENRHGDENNYSVCVMFHHGSRQFLFTGDLEVEGEEKLAEQYDFSQVELFKAGHHGSPTSSNECLLKEIKPKICVACCCAGSVQYTDNLLNTFPSQAVIDRIAPYTDKFYVPITINIVQTEGAQTPNDTSDDDYSNSGEIMMLNGNIVVISKATQEVYVECSNNNTLLKDTDWFKNYRTTPTAWLSAS